MAVSYNCRSISFGYNSLSTRLVLPRGLSSDISNNYRSHALFNQLNILIRYIHIYYYVIVINVIGLVTNNFFSLCITPPYIFDMYLIEHFVLGYVNNIKIGILITSLIHEYIVAHTLWLVFLYK